MDGDVDDNDFEYQLQQEALEAERKLKESSDQTTAGSSSSSNPYIYKDPNDGTEYEWDHQKKAWFPKITEDFIARYQASYGQQFFDSQSENKSNSNEINNATDNDSKNKNLIENQVYDKTENIEKSTDNTSKTNIAISNENDQKIGRKRPAKDEPPQWFEVDDEHNTNVYVSNLPLDITEDEFITLMKKCGLIMKDDLGQLKIKLYLDQNGMPKGDGRCCYIKVESVELALKILDGYSYRDHTIKVERAKFALKGEYNPSLKPKKKKNKKDKVKQKQKMEKLFDWRPEKLPGVRPNHEKVVVIKNMFDVTMFEHDPRLILEYKADLRDECNESCGPVRKVEIYDLHPDGVATVAFHEFQHADKCVEVMNGRFFAGRKLTANHWDGKTKFKIQETDEEIEKRMKKWDDFLEHEPEESQPQDQSQP